MVCGMWYVVCGMWYVDVDVDVIHVGQETRK